MQFLFPSKFLAKIDNQDQKEALRKVGTEMTIRIPEGMERNKTYNVGYCNSGTKKLRNKLQRVPTKIIKQEVPGAAVYSVSSWNKNEVILDITTAGIVNFILY